MRLLRKWPAWPKSSAASRAESSTRAVLRTGHAHALLLLVYRLWRTITCGMLAIKPSNKPLHLTAARSLGPAA
jgi:hypothetical protein